VFKLEGDEWIDVGQHKKGFSATIVSIGIEESSPRVQELDIVLDTTNVKGRWMWRAAAQFWQCHTVSHIRKSE